MFRLNHIVNRAFAANTKLSPAEADAFHRAHARVELAIQDIKAHAGLSHCPQVTSSPTPPGWPARYWLTTSTDGQNTPPDRSDN